MGVTHTIRSIAMMLYSSNATGARAASGVLERGMHLMFAKETLAKALLGLTLTASALSLASPAQAINHKDAWGTLQYEESGRLQGLAFGDFWVENSNGTHAKSKGSVKDARPGGAAIYYNHFTQVNDGSCFAPTYTSCTKSWFDHDWEDSAKFTTNVWNPTSVTTTVSTGGNFARARMKVCEVRSLSFDPCSNTELTNGDGY